MVTKNGVPKKVKVRIKIRKEADIVVADSDILKRVLGNLVTNGVQATPEGGKLSINVYKEADNSVIAVADTA